MRASFEHTDEELLRRALSGDGVAFATLYRRRQAGLYRFALQMCGSEAAAEDVVQEVFVALLRDGSRFDAGRGALSSYLYGIARKQVLRRLEKERSFVALANEQEQAESADALPSTRPDPLAEFAESELVERVRGAVLTLPAHYREVVVLCELHEMSYAEAACVLGCAVGTVRSRLHRARAMLCERLRVFDAQRGEAAGDLDAARCFA